MAAAAAATVVRIVLTAGCDFFIGIHDMVVM
jgi:hypothetical protein